MDGNKNNIRELKCALGLVKEQVIRWTKNIIINVRGPSGCHKGAEKQQKKMKTLQEMENSQMNFFVPEEKARHTKATFTGLGGHRGEMLDTKPALAELTIQYGKILAMG